MEEILLAGLLTNVGTSLKASDRVCVYQIALWIDAAVLSVIRVPEIFSSTWSWLPELCLYFKSFIWLLIILIVPEK